MIYQSANEAQSSGLIRRIICGVIAAPVIYAIVWGVLALGAVW